MKTKLYLFNLYSFIIPAPKKKKNATRCFRPKSMGPSLLVFYTYRIDDLSSFSQCSYEKKIL